jgi:hypothetical protein
MHVCTYIHIYIYTHTHTPRGRRRGTRFSDPATPAIRTPLHWGESVLPTPAVQKAATLATHYQQFTLATKYLQFKKQPLACADQKQKCQKRPTMGAKATYAQTFDLLCADF